MGVTATGCAEVHPVTEFVTNGRTSIDAVRRGLFIQIDSSWLTTVNENLSHIVVCASTRAASQLPFLSEPMF